MGLPALREMLAQLPRAASAETFDAQLRRCLALRYPVRHLSIAPLSDAVSGLPPSLEPRCAPLFLRDGAASQVVTLPLSLGGVVVAVLEVVLETDDLSPMLELRGLAEPLAARVLTRPGAAHLAPPQLLLEHATYVRAVHGTTGCGRTHDAFHLATRFPDGRDAEELLRSLGDPGLVASVELWLLDAALRRAQQDGLTRLALRPSTAALATRRLRELLVAAPLPVVLELADAPHIVAYHEAGPIGADDVEVVAVLDPRIPLRAA